MNPAPSDCPITCNQCGITSDIRETFVTQRKSLRRFAGTLCPQCHHKSELATSKWLVFLKFVPGGLGLLIVLTSRDPGGASVGWFFLNFFCFEMFLVAVILPHELGHAFVARLVGLRVFKLYVGSGKPVFIVKLLGFRIEFGAIPLGGVTIAAHRDATWFRLRQLAYIVAGPVANALLAISVFGFVSASHFWDFDKLGQGMAFGQVFVCANLLVLVRNLWPHQIGTSLGMIASDGKALWQTLFLKRETIDNNYAAWFALEGLTCQENGQFANALSWFERGIIQFPKHLLLLSLNATVLIHLKRYGEARDCSLKILAGDTKPANRALMKNNIAYIDALLGGAELLAEADRYSQEALAGLGWVPAVKGTRGAVLLQLDRAEEAIPLLRESMEQTNEASGKAQNACWISMAETRRGHLTESRKYLDEAERLMPDCMLLERAAAVLEKALKESACPQSHPG